MKKVVSGISFFIGFGLAMIESQLGQKNELEMAVTIFAIVFFMMIVPVTLMIKR